MTSLFFHWFFAKAPGEIFSIGRNFLLWGWRFFSIGYFVPRLFAPWHRDITPYGRGFDLKRFLHIFGWNLISRFLGAVMRIVVMVFGLVMETLILTAAVGIFLAWIFLPAIILVLLVSGFLLIF